MRAVVAARLRAERWDGVIGRGRRRALTTIFAAIISAAAHAAPARAQPTEYLASLQSVQVEIAPEALYRARRHMIDIGLAEGFVARGDDALIQMFRSDMYIKVIGDKINDWCSVAVAISDGARKADPIEVQRLLLRMTAALAAYPGAVIHAGPPRPSVYAVVPPAEDPIAVVEIAAPAGDLAEIAEEIADFAFGEGYATQVAGSAAAGLTVQLYRSDMAVLGRTEPATDRATLWLTVYEGPMVAHHLGILVRGIVARAEAHDGVEARWVE